MSSLAFDGLHRKTSVRDERIVGKDVETAVGLRVRSALSPYQIKIKCLPHTPSHTVTHSLTYHPIHTGSSPRLRPLLLTTFPPAVDAGSHRGMPLIIGRATKQAVDVVPSCRWRLAQARLGALFAGIERMGDRGARGAVSN
jgi:hypothetical protein